ncbi:MAG: hypothetical protein COA60_000935 [Robiginitomaculum sp.]|nr:hypothetical protein [Robiginitomaculum sp.]
MTFDKPGEIPKRRHTGLDPVSSLVIVARADGGRARSRVEHGIDGLGRIARHGGFCFSSPLRALRAHLPRKRGRKRVVIKKTVLSRISRVMTVGGGG